MKKSLLAVVAALAIAGCSQNDLADEIDNGGQPINFKSVVMKNSRAVATTSANFSNFTVYAYTSTGAWANAGNYYFTDDITKTDNVWGGNKTIYWPATDNVHFFAYAPKSATYAPVTGNLTAYPALSYSVPSTASAQEDLIAACATNKIKGEDDVDLAFKHLLTQVNFSVTAPLKGLTYTIEAIKLTGVNNKGIFTYDGTSTVGTWEVADDATPTEYPYASTQTGHTATADNETIILTGAEALMLLPKQDIVTLSVTYKIKQNDTTILESTTKTSDITANWAPGKNVLYQITLPTTNLNTIKVTGTISDEWGAATSEKPTIQ